MELVGQIIQHDLGTARDGLGGCGTQTAALAFGGNTPGVFIIGTEEYNGSSWTSGRTFK
jgi:hypothetical protein